jgi:hypothetical protein
MRNRQKPSVAKLCKPSEMMRNSLGLIKNPLLYLAELTGARFAQTYTALPGKEGTGAGQKKANGATSLASTVRHVRQPSHGSALVVSRKVCVLPGNCRAFVPYDFPRDKV